MSVIDNVVLDIRRSHLLTDALREAHKGKYCEGWHSYYTFGICHKMYSPYRSNLLVRILPSMSARDTFFIGDSDRKIFDTNVSAVQVRQTFLS